MAPTKEGEIPQPDQTEHLVFPVDDALISSAELPPAVQGNGDSPEFMLLTGKLTSDQYEAALKKADRISPVSFD